MKIKTKFFMGTSAMLVAAVMITTVAVIFILELSFAKEREFLVNSLRSRSFERLNSGNHVLKSDFAQLIKGIEHEAEKLSQNEIIRHGIPLGQWKAIDAQLYELAKEFSVDFIILFDKRGRLQNTWPNQISAIYPEDYLKNSKLQQMLTNFSIDDDLPVLPPISSVEKWGRDVFKGYQCEIDGEAGIVIVTTGVILNDYQDELIGSYMMGVSQARLFSLLRAFTDTTGQISFFADSNNPLVWSGLPGEGNDIKAMLQASRSMLIERAASIDPLHQLLDFGEKYYVHVEKFSDFIAASDTVAAPSMGSIVVVTGEPKSLITDAIEKIVHQSENTKNKVLSATLLVALFILILSTMMVNFIGNKIARPISLAAEMSDTIASGNLDSVLNETGSDEIDRLARSMNVMSAKLKDLREKDKEQLKTIEEGKKRSESILSVIQEGLLIVDIETKTIIEMNAAAATLINSKDDEVVGDLCQHYLCVNENGCCPIIDRNESIKNSEGILLTKNHTQLPVLRTVVPIVLDGRKCLLESFTDISRLKKAERESKTLQDQLHKAQKMELLGTVAGGVAHDLNNILSGLMSYPELLLMGLPNDSPMRPPLMTIKKSGEKAAAIVQDLLTMARRGVAVGNIVNLNDIVSDYLESPEFQSLTSSHRNVDVDAQLEPALSNILGSSVHLSKTLMNLISNAAEAMPDGGQLLIRTENHCMDIPVKGYEEIPAGEYAVLSVCDSGIGIEKENFEHIFEPFYTQKIMGKSGTGLGMAVVWGTIKDHHGYIDMQSTVGKGTTFTLYFPVTKKAWAKQRSSIPFDKYAGWQESILVVDDVPDQREITLAILKKLNYSAIAVSSGEEAVEYLKNNNVELILLDMIMENGMDGLDTYKKIVERWPGQKAIITSGYSESDRVREIQELGVRQYIKKPYSIENIGLAIRKELNNK